jgi:hypothetical protein
MNTFEKKRPHFSAEIVRFEPFTEDATTGNTARTEKELEINTTVPKELDWVSDFLIKGLNVSYQVAVGNTMAKADIVLDDDKGTVLAKSIPASTLLELEKRMGELMELVKAIPTLDPVKGFKVDADKGADIFKARDKQTIRTQKINRPLVLHNGNDKHPPQVQVESVDVPIGHVTTMEWPGLITPQKKGEMIDRVEILQRAVKRARSRANEVDVDTASLKIGASLVKFAFDGTV